MGMSYVVCAAPARMRALSPATFAARKITKIRVENFSNFPRNKTTLKRSQQNGTMRVKTLKCAQEHDNVSFKITCRVINCLFYFSASYPE